jgi:hypothetical protein
MRQAWHCVFNAPLVLLFNDAQYVQVEVLEELGTELEQQRLERQQQHRQSSAGGARQ